MRYLKYHDFADMAERAIGNWRKFESFGWNRAWDGSIPDPDNWTIVYTHNRDSGLLDQSNADAIEKIMKPFLEAEDPDIIWERHNHWARGWIDGYAIRVRKDISDNKFCDFSESDCLDLWKKYGFVREEITEAFKAYCEIAEQLENYPVLDEEDYSRREYEATIENIEKAGRRYLKDEVPEDWANQCFSWFWNNNQSAVENRDDQGGYPSKEDMLECLEELGFLHEDYIEDLEEEESNE